MAIPLVVSGLLKKRALLQAELEYHERHIAKCRVALEHFDATLALYEESRNAKAVTRRYLVNSKSNLFAYGYVSNTVVEVLRKSNKPLTASEVTQRFLDGLECDVTPEQKKYLRRTIGWTLANKVLKRSVSIKYKIGRINYYILREVDS
jgi:hypothetical protein